MLIHGGYLLPDVTLLSPMSGEQQPTTAYLVIEIAETSQARDLQKSRDYAVADVAEYWTVDLLARPVIVLRGNSPPSGASGRRKV